MQGVIAMITGAASGIGLATARRLRDEGAHGLVLIDRDAEALERIEDEFLADDDKGLVTVMFDHDVTDAASWPRLEEKVREIFGGIDRLVVNAGVADNGEIAEMGFDAWRRVLSINLDGAFLTLQTGLRLIRAGGKGGSVVVVGSAAGIKAEPGVGAYAASKAAVLQLARVAAREHAAAHIRINAIAPGGVETPIWEQAPFFQTMVEQTGSARAAFDQMAAMATPLGRFATADEIAGQIAFLLSDASAPMTGAVLVSDGGYTL